VGPEADKYRLSVSGFSGDVGDAIAATVHPLTASNRMHFSTPDQDNKRWSLTNRTIQSNSWKMQELKKDRPRNTHRKVTIAECVRPGK